MTENNTFSSSGQDVIAKSLDVVADHDADALDADAFGEYYEIARTVEEIVRGSWKRIALQFPDELLHDSVRIFRALKDKIGDDQQLFVLADTSYGSCCVDEVAASHVDADAMVHYGHACMSKTSRLPVVYVLGKKPLDVEHCVPSFVDALAPEDKRTILLKSDVMFSHTMEQVRQGLAAALPEHQILYSAIPLFSLPSSTMSSSSGDGDGETIPSEDLAVLYVGPESLALTNLLMTFSQCNVYSYDPSTRSARLESGRTNKLLMRRYASVQRARDADVFGILVGTLGVAAYLPLITHLRALLKRARKKSYTLAVGKLNPAKLGNFLEVETFVLVACPENSLIDAKEFLRPIITPYELEIVLRAETSWTGRYVLDFERLLAESATALPSADDEDDARKDAAEDDPDEPVFSLVSGKYRHAKRYGGGEASESAALLDGASTDVILRSQEHALVLADSVAGAFLQGRSWKGLERRLGEDAPARLEQGRSGIARGYGEDTQPA